MCREGHGKRYRSSDLHTRHTVTSDLRVLLEAIQWAHIKTPHLFLNEILSLFLCSLSGPSSFVINHEVHHCLATLAIAVSATFPDTPQLDTNAKRFAAGLNTTLPPHRRNLGTPVYGTQYFFFFRVSPSFFIFDKVLRKDTLPANHPPPATIDLSNAVSLC